MAIEAFDVVVLGTGAGGLTAAEHAKQAGANVALVEKDRPGGDCTYYGCVPSKALIHSAKVLHYIRRAQEYGLPRVDVQPDFREVMAHAQRVIDKVSAEGSFEPWRDRGFRVFQGEGRFVDPHELEVAGERVRGDKFVIATGTDPAVPPIEGLAEAGYITNIQAVSLPEQPAELAILGAGPIGTEFAQFFTRMETKVTVLGMYDQILPKEDPEVAGRLRTILEEEGVTIHTGAKVEQVLTQGGKKLVVANKGGERLEVLVDEILVATGRRPATSEIALDVPGVATRRGGWIEVDDTLRTSAAHIWAVGDCVGRLLFTHVASYQGDIVGHNMFAKDGDLERYDGSVIPWATFTEPPLARVGLTEQQAREKHGDVRVARLEFSDIERAHIMLEAEGMMKVVADADKRILGATILGPHADELIHELALAVKLGLRAGDVRSLIHAYPTLAEGVREVVNRL